MDIAKFLEDQALVAPVLGNSDDEFLSNWIEWVADQKESLRRKGLPVNDPEMVAHMGMTVTLSAGFYFRLHQVMKDRYSPRGNYVRGNQGDTTG